MKSAVPGRKPVPQNSQIFQSRRSLINNQVPNITTRNRSNSSSVLNSNIYPPKNQNKNSTSMQVKILTISTPPASSPTSPFSSRRTPSNATCSTYTSSNNGLSYRHNLLEPKRSMSSSRSYYTPRATSYVTLMRKQKATVWCDRAQLEDSRLLAEQKAAKIRASWEVTGIHGTHKSYNSGSASLSSGNKVAAKIRHHGKASLVGYNPSDLVGGVGGVPLRLSATEVEGGDSNDETDSPHLYDHSKTRRSGSGRSSINSNRTSLTYPRRLTTGSMSRNWSYTSAKNPADQQQQAFKENPLHTSQSSNPDSIPRDAYTNLTADEISESAREKEDSLAELYTTRPGNLTNITSLKSSAVTRKQSFKTIDQIRRRGSVDDRAATQSTVRLYIANPDIDSD